MQVYELMYVRLHYVGMCGSVQFILLASLRWCSQEPECQRAWVMTLPLCECERDGEACGQNAQWWDAVRHREENEERGNDMQQKWSDWNETTGKRSYLCCVSDDLSPVCHQGKHKPAEFHYHKETFTLTEYLQTVSSLCVFQGSFICHSTNTELHNEMKVVVPECYTKFRGWAEEYFLSNIKQWLCVSPWMYLRHNFIISLLPLSLLLVRRR